MVTIIYSNKIETGINRSQQNPRLKQRFSCHLKLSSVSWNHSGGNHTTTLGSATIEAACELRRSCESRRGKRSPLTNLNTPSDPSPNWISGLASTASTETQDLRKHYFYLAFLEQGLKAALSDPRSLLCKLHLVGQDPSVPSPRLAWERERVSRRSATITSLTTRSLHMKAKEDKALSHRSARAVGGEAKLGARLERRQRKTV